MRRSSLVPESAYDGAEASRLACGAGRSLRQSELLAGLSDAQAQAVALTARVVEVKRRDWIYRLGDPCAHIFIVKAGVVEITTVACDDREMVLEFLYPGALFGESALLDLDPRDHTACAYEDVGLYALDREPLLRLVRGSAELAYQIARLMALRVRRCSARAGLLLCRTADARVAHLLLALAAQHSVADADGVLIPLRLNQATLASLAGLTRETVNGVLRDFRSRGLVEADRHSIRLKDPAALRSAR